MFTTERLVLRAPNDETDLEPLLHAFNNLDNRVPLGSSPLLPMTKEELKKRFFDTSKPRTLPDLIFCLKPSDGAFTTADKKPLPPLGMVFLPDFKYNAKNRTAMVGLLVFDPADRGKGYGREALTWTLEYAFMELGVHRIELEVYSFNQRAIGLYRSIGFVDEGRKRKCYYKSGVWHDELNMAVLDEEWLEIRKKNSVRVLPPHLR